VAEKTEKVIYRGTSMAADWPEKIRQAQEIRTCFANGQDILRIRYGDEEDDWGADIRPCHDCGVIKSEFHVEGCDVERCAGCGGQRFNCDCEPSEDEVSA
jgi:hypothetical protein